MPNQGQEIEIKLQFTSEADWLRAKAHFLFDDIQPKQQNNLFFDVTDQRLRKQKCALRLRDEDGCFFLTAKGPASARMHASVSARPEEEIETSPEHAALLLQNPQHMLQTLVDVLGERDLLLYIRNILSDDKLQSIGGFRNERFAKSVTMPRSFLDPLDGLASAYSSKNIEAVFEFDKTHLPGRIDFELEVEIYDDTNTHDLALLWESYIKQELQTLGVEVVPARGKASRFFEAQALDAKMGS